MAERVRRMRKRKKLCLVVLRRRWLAQGYDGVAMGLDATLLIGGVQAQIRACRG